MHPSSLVHIFLSIQLKMVKRSMSGRNDVQVFPAQAKLMLFDSISTAFETCGAGPAECGLLLLRGRLLLLLGLLAGRCILAAALPTRGNRTDRGTGTGIPADDLAHHCAARAPQAYAGVVPVAVVGVRELRRWRFADRTLTVSPPE
jgi:hypothetical protein